MGWINPNVQQVQPIVTYGSLASNSVVQTITPAGGYNVVNQVDVSAYQSYDLNTYIYTTAGAGGPIVALYQLLWYDELISGIPVFEEQYWIWLGRTNAQYPDTMGATGPMHGRYMTVNVSIPTTATGNATLQYFNLFGSPRPTQWSDWRQDAFETNPSASGITIVPNGPFTGGYENVLCNVKGAALAAGATVWVPLNLYAGPVYLRFAANQVPNQDPVLCVADNIINTGITAGTASNQLILVNFSPDAAEHEVTLIAPRAPMYFVVHGITSTTSNFDLNVIGQQAA
jgi:hypothetical protein